MKVGSGLLTQLERCGLSAKLADEHPEAGEDKRDFRNVKLEIGRAWGSRTQATLPDADTALSWLVSQPFCAEQVNEPLDLVDEETGEVLVTGRPGAVAIQDDGEVLVLRWTTGDEFDAPEPEDDIGLVAMGLAGAKGRPFRVATVGLKNGNVFPRRSRLFEAAEHPALWARIRAAASRPRIACPGDWCGACRQAPYCEAWLARAKTALAVLGEEAPLTEGADGKPQIPQLDLTDESASAVMARIKLVEKAAELAKDQIKSFVRHGGSCIVNGKEYYPGGRAGKESVSIEAMKELTAPREGDTDEVAKIKKAVAGIIKTGQPYEQFGWRNPKAVRR